MNLSATFDVARTKIERNGYTQVSSAKFEDALETLAEKELGKTVLLTDRNGFSDEGIIRAYRSACYVEKKFHVNKRYGSSSCETSFSFE